MLVYPRIMPSVERLSSKFHQLPSKLFIFRRVFQPWALSCNWGFSLSHHHQNHSTNKVKNERGKRRWTFKQSRKDSGLCDFSCGRYSKKFFAQIYKAMYGDAVFVSLWGAQIWRPEAHKYRCHRVCYQKPVVVFWGLINFYMCTYSHTGTVQIAKFQQISHFFNLRYSILGRPFNNVSRKSLEIQPCLITRRKTLSN